MTNTANMRRQMKNIKIERLPVDGPRLLSVQKAAKELGIHDATARRLAKNGQLPSIKLGGRIKIYREGLERLLTLPDGN